MSESNAKEGSNQPAGSTSGTIQADQKLFDVGDAATYLQQIGARTATVNFVRALISSGQVAFLRIGKKHYLSKAALDRWIETRERRTR